MGPSLRGEGDIQSVHEVLVLLSDVVGLEGVEGEDLVLPDSRFWCRGVGFFSLFGFTDLEDMLVSILKGDFSPKSIFVGESGLFSRDPFREVFYLQIGKGRKNGGDEFWLGLLQDIFSMMRPPLLSKLFVFKSSDWGRPLGSYIHIQSFIIMNLCRLTYRPTHECKSVSIHRLK